MNLLLKDEYVHIGTDSIQKELWLNPQMDQIYKDYIKPYGGLWTSHQNKDSICDWLEYKEQENKLDEIEHLKSCLIKFKENSKLLIINNSNDYTNLKSSGFIKNLTEPIIIDKWYYKVIIKELIDYEKICDFYDLLYVNNNAHKNLNNYSIKTMFALTPNCIEYYKPIRIDYNKLKILEIDEKKFIEEPTKDYYELINYIRKLFNNINDENYETYIKKLYEQSKFIINYLKDNINKINIPPTINRYFLIETIVRNIYRELYLEKQKTLIKK